MPELEPLSSPASSQEVNLSISGTPASLTPVIQVAQTSVAEEPEITVKKSIELCFTPTSGPLGRHPLSRSCTTPNNLHTRSLVHSQTSVYLGLTGNEISPSASETARRRLPRRLLIETDSLDAHTGEGASIARRTDGCHFIRCSKSRKTPNIH